MRETFFLILLIGFLFSTHVVAELSRSGDLHPRSEESAIQKNTVKYFSINIEFSGLDESTFLLKQSMNTLTAALSEAAKSPNDLSVEQIQALESLITKSDVLIVSLERALIEVGPMISNAKQPAQEMVAAVLDKARVEAINPTLLSIKRTGRHWIFLIVVGLILIVVLVGVALYFMTRQLREFAQILKAISNDYEIVRRSN